MKTILYFQSPAKTTAPAKFEGVREITEKAGLHVQVFDEMPTRRRVVELAKFWEPVGAIVECSTELKSIRQDAFGNLPVVFFNPASEMGGRAFTVSHDQSATGELAARELMTTGFRSFAFIPVNPTARWNDERGAAYVAALKLNRLPCAVFSCVERDNLERLKALRRFLSGLPRPTAVFAANDRTGEEVLAAAALEGIAVPEGLSVLGVDNYEPICEHTKPKLSSIAPDFRRGGNLAALLLIAAVRAGKNFKGDRQRRFGPLRIVRRASTRVLLKPDRAVSAALDFIQREACNGLTAARVAKLFNCSRRLADLRFRAATGRSILDEIHSVQLDRAKQLLSDPNRMLKSISDFCGFRHPNSLRKFFKKSTGRTLSSWRKDMVGPKIAVEQRPSCFH